MVLFKKSKVFFMVMRTSNEAVIYGYSLRVLIFDDIE
jgi:hypothetical protein